jgi:DnaJ-class molecular chaperone
MRIECPECNGSGEVDYGITLECPVCEGSGEIDKDEFPTNPPSTATTVLARNVGCDA